MKKIILFIIFLLLFPNVTMASERITGEYGSYDDAKKIVKEVMKDYYIRGTNLQYNYSKVTYGKEAPEESTYQDIKYAVCAAYTYDVYTEAFGVNYSIDGFPIYNTTITREARNFYNNATQKDLDGHLLIYYESNISDETEGNAIANNIASDKKKYVYGGSDDIDDVIDMLQPGDMFVFTGHALIAYDIVTRANGEKDILMLNSSRSSLIPTRIDGSTTKLVYDIGANANQSEKDINGNYTLNIDAEGTVKKFWLRKSSNFVKDGKLSCKDTHDECGIIRPYYKNQAGNAVFNYSIDEDQYKKSLLRTNYPGLYIEKTVDKNDNNSVYLGDELTYTIKIVNKSSVIGYGTNYNSFNVEEELGDYVLYKSSNNNGVISNNSVKWTIDNLAIGDSIELKYTVKIKNSHENIGKTISAKGMVYANNRDIYISTGSVDNKIISNSFVLQSSYQECYQNNIDKTGLELINEIYKCTSGINLELNNFDFNGIFGRKENPTQKAVEDAIYVKSNLDAESSKFYKMILNNYWSALVKYKSSDSGYYLDLPLWGGDSAINRAKTINAADFQDGDVLIYNVNYATYDTSNSNFQYTAEDGTYAYIYLDGKFVGNNYSGQSNERNEYLFNYYVNNTYFSGKNLKTYFYKGYSDSLSNDEKEFINYQRLFGKDYYVILRPSQMMHTVNYYEGEEKIGSSVCVYNQDCSLNSYKSFNREFPNKANKWSFYGWTTDTDSTTTIDYLNITEPVNEVNVYAVGKRTFNYYGGISPTYSYGSTSQYWNTYSNITSKVWVPQVKDIPGWSFIGYRATNDTSSSVIISNSYNNTTNYNPRYDRLTNLEFRSIYKRTVTVNYNINGGEGSIEPDSQVQYYNSGTSGQDYLNSLTFTLPKGNNLRKNGYVFAGWGESSHSDILSGENYDFNPSVSDNNVTKTLYAIWQEWEFLKGDMNKNSKIDLLDIIKILKIYLGIDESSAEEIQIGDIDYDNTITLLDVVALIKIYLCVE